MDKLLTLAENLEEKCSQKERQVMLAWGLLWTIVAGGVLVAFFLWTLTSLDLLFKTMLTVGCLVYLAGVGVVVARGDRSMSTHLARDRRALYEIVDMLREVEGAVVERGQRSALERAEFRIRLARLDIGPSYSQGAHS